MNNEIKQPEALLPCSPCPWCGVLPERIEPPWFEFEHKHDCYMQIIFKTNYQRVSIENLEAWSRRASVASTEPYRCIECTTPISPFCKNCQPYPASTTPSAQLTEHQWYDIETAPKDGTSVLLCWHPPQPIGAIPTIVQASWICRKHRHLSIHHDCPNEANCEMGWGMYAGIMSHWKPLGPLPSPPDERGAQEK